MTLPKKIEVRNILPDKDKALADVCVAVNEIIDHLVKPEKPEEEEIPVGTDVRFKLFYPGIDEVKIFTGKVTRVKKVAEVEYIKEDGKMSKIEVEIKLENIKKI